MKTKPTTPAPAHTPTEPEIQELAYRLWIEGGCRPGVELDNWFAAEEMLRHRVHVPPADHARAKPHHA